MNTVLVIEDEPDIAQLISMTLMEARLHAIVTNDGEHGLQQALQCAPDIILLDLMLPRMDGWNVCRQLRTTPRTQQIPIMILSACASEEDRVEGLELGADDYITKPFGKRELIARVHAVLRRRTKQNEDMLLRVGDIEIDLQHQTVRVGHMSISLTMTEFTILQRLAHQPGRIFSNERLLTYLWGEDCYVTVHGLDAHIHTLRQKLECDPRAPRQLLSISGQGHTLRETVTVEES